jgi:hypothetical protein
VDFQGQLEILEKLVGIIKRPVTRKPKKKHSLLELEGLGKEIWKDIDVDDYIDKERNSWN